MNYLAGQAVVLYGESIGAAIAVEIALEYPVKAIILQAPFTSLADVGAYHYPWIPVRWLLRDKYETLVKASKIHVPICILHGEHDGIIPIAMSENLFSAFNEPKLFKRVPFTGHNDLYEPQFVIDYISCPFSD
jgi:fermentation-respiration switch protein FrsA (DUF1100 family)